MADLRKFCEEQGFSNVQTYIQSGNLVFETANDDTDKIGEDLEGLIRKHYGFEVPVLVLKPADLGKVIAGNPFLSESNHGQKGLYVAFLYETPEIERIKMLEEISFDEEFFEIQQNWVYMYFPGGYGKARLNNNFLEQKLKVPATTRNWKTVNTLFNMSGQ